MSSETDAEYRQRRAELARRGPEIAAVAEQLSQQLGRLAPPPNLAISAIASLLANVIAVHAADDATAERLAATIAGELADVVRINRNLLRGTPGKPPNTVEVGHG